MAAPDAVVAQVALRTTVNRNLIFKWLHDPEYRPQTATTAPQIPATVTP